MSLIGLPLTLASTGEHVEVTAITGDRAMQKRLGDLGVCAGKALRVIQKDASGQMVVALGDARLALGREMTLQIFVTPREPGRRERM